LIVGSDVPIPAGHNRIILVRQGAVRLSYGAEERIVLSQSLILVLPGTAHRIAAAAGAVIAQVAFGRSVLDPETLGSAAGGLLRMFGDVRDPAQAGSGIRVTRLPTAVFEEACSIFRHIEAEGRELRSGYEIMQRLRLMELLMVFYRYGQSGTDARASEPGRFRIEDAVRYIQDHYADDHSLPGLASRFGLNPSYLSRLFARHTGVPLFAYVNRIRIQKSCLLLKRSTLSIVEIAFSVGYNNLSHFNRYFRRIMGMSPREYRNRSKK
jgi:AraC-like DNA-binding protein